MTTPTPEWVTIPVAATLTGKSDRTIWRLIDRDRLRTAKAEGRTLVRIEAVRKAIGKTQTGRPRKE